jgi:hypothetical protein
VVLARIFRIINISFLRVGGGARGPDLSLGSSQRSDVAHLHHGRHECAGERRRVGGEVADDVIGAAAVEELLVRVQEPLLRQQVLEVGVVERGGRRRVQRRHDAAAAGPGAARPERARERLVDVGVVVDVVLVARAMRLTDRVPTCKQHVQSLDENL